MVAVVSDIFSEVAAAAAVAAVAADVVVQGIGGGRFPDFLGMLYELRSLRSNIEFMSLFWLEKLGHPRVHQKC